MELEIIIFPWCLLLLKGRYWALQPRIILLLLLCCMEKLGEQCSHSSLYFVISACFIPISFLFPVNFRFLRYLSISSIRSILRGILFSYFLDKIKFLLNFLSKLLFKGFQMSSLLFFFNGAVFFRIDCYGNFGC